MGEKVYSAPTFGLTFDNIPLINLRLEFNRTYQFIHSPEAGEILRTPIKQICNSDLSKIQYAFLHVARIYEWIDHWFDPENLVPGGKALSGAHLCGPIGTGHAAT